MFGQNNAQPQNDITIPDQSVDEAANATQPAALPDWQHPGMPIDTPANSDTPAADAPAASLSDMPIITAPAELPHTDLPHTDLLDIKQQALQALTPLVGHLDQSPEEKFRTTMMMIQASDDQSMVKTAYEAANGIADEKLRAQALLDVINEINYFTQPHPQA